MKRSLRIFHMPSLRLCLNPPNDIQRFLKLSKYTGCAEQQQNKGQDRGNDAGGGLPGFFDHALNGFRTLLADEALNLPDNLALRRLLSEH